MIDLQEAQQRVLEQTLILPKKQLPLTEALGHVLAEEVRTYEDIPTFDSSAMDGFAVHPSDTEGASQENPVVLKVTGEIRAGCGELARRGDAAGRRPLANVHIWTGKTRYG